MGKESNGLHGLAETHFVSQNTVEPVLVQRLTCKGRRKNELCCVI